MPMQAQQTPPAAPAPAVAPVAPAPPAVQAAPAPSGQLVVSTEPATPQTVLQGLREQRRELQQQLENLNDERGDIARELRTQTENRAAPEGADRAGLEARLTTIDGRIAETEALLRTADLQVAQAAAVPGAVVREPPRPPDHGEEIAVVGSLFIVVVLLPLTVAYSRRLWKRGAAAVTTIPKELYDRFTQLEQSVDAVAVEVERIGEGQRFITRVFSENTDARGIAAAAHALPVERLPAHDADPLPRHR